MFKTFLTTLLVLMGLTFYILSVSVVIKPDFAIKVYDFLGAEKASLACYEQIYKNEGSMADLYNLVQKSIEYKDYKRTTKYIKELQEKNEYSNFCIQVNNALINSSSKQYVAYVGDLDSFLISQNIIAMYQDNKTSKARELATADLISNNIYSFGFGSFVDCVIKDSNITWTQEKQILKQMKTETVTINGKTDLLINFIKTRIEKLKLSGNETFAEKILKVYTELKINNTLLKIYEASEDEDLVNQTRSQINKLQEIYNGLVK